MSRDMILHNARVTFETIDIGGRTIQVAVPGRPNACWLTSLATAIGPMAREEIDRDMDGPERVAARILSHVFEMLGRWLSVDDVVFPEHRLLSTSLYDRDQLAHLIGCRDSLMRHYPGKAIVIRSLNAHDHASYIDKGCWPFRLVWIIEDVSAEWAPRRDAQRDVALLAALGMTQNRYGRDMPMLKLARCIELYRHLYLATYSHFNPDYDGQYLWQLLEDGELDILTLEAEGQVQAFCALHAKGNVLSVPMVGYDQSRPQSDGLYRAVMALAALAAQAQGLRLNLSAGAPHFKRHRGAKPHMEYLMIIDRHLPWWRRFAYAAIGVVLRLMEPELRRPESKKPESKGPESKGTAS